MTVIRGPRKYPPAPMASATLKRKPLWPRGSPASIVVSAPSLRYVKADDADRVAVLTFDQLADHSFQDRRHRSPARLDRGSRNRPSRDKRIVRCWEQWTEARHRSTRTSELKSSSIKCSVHGLDTERPPFLSRRQGFAVSVPGFRNYRCFTYFSGRPFERGVQCAGRKVGRTQRLRSSGPW
jgi:hypothetical protein